MLVLTFSLAVGIAVTLVSCPGGGRNKAALIPPEGKYDVRILRDTWGVPHILGKTDADCAYGLAYAHAEDDMPTILEALLGARGNLAAFQGKDAAPIDFMVQLMRVCETVDEKYETDLSPDVRAVCEAYADGLNHYGALHPKEIPASVLPITGKDIVAGFVFKTPLFYGLDGQVKGLFGDKRRRPVSEKQPVPEQQAGRPIDQFLTGGVVTGSNAFAVSPKRSANGETFLNINSHQPWDGIVAWYEAHLKSEEGLDIVGGLFPGTPVVLLGHNRNLGWAHTVNEADLVDIYVLDMNPDNPNQYRFDGEWRDLEVRDVYIKVKIWGPISWRVKREAAWSVYGPTVRQPHGVYAIRYAGMGDIRQVEQWFRMGKASNFKEWQDAMRMGAIASFNCLYADKHGTIYYLFNAQLPIRAEGYDWKQYLPGDTSETLWTECLPVDQLPQVLNPESGFVMSCNNTPFRTTTGPGNPDPAQYSPTLSIDTRMTNRALRALELLGGDDSITFDEFIAYKFDMHYSKEGTTAKKLKQLLEAPAPEDPLTREAFELLRQWDLQMNPENTAAALGVFTIGPDPNGRTQAGNVDDMLALIKDNALALKDAHGRIDVPWGDVNRLYRGELNIPIGGGPDILHAVYGSRIRGGKLEGLENGQIHGRAGDCYFQLVAWDKDGNMTAHSMHQFGSATSRPDSPHYADQAPLFAARKLKPTWMDEAEIREHLEREYRPGEETMSAKEAK